MNKKRIIIGGAVALALLVVIGSIIFGMNRTANNPERRINLGEKYLLEMDYEQALVQFLKVIEIDPMNPRGYTGAAEAYIGLGRTDEAIAVLRQGLNVTGDASISDMLDDLLSASEQSLETELTDAAEVNSVDGIKNFSGAEPFTAKDIGDWGFPVGVTIWDVQERLGLSTDEINDELSRAKEFTQWEIPNGFTTSWYNCQLSIGDIVNDVFNGVYIIMDESTGQVKGVRMDGYSNVLPEGPRGIKAGTTINDVLMRFMVHNSDAFNFTESLDYGMFTSNDDFISIYDTNSNGRFSGHFMQYASIGQWFSGTEDTQELGGATVFYDYQQDENTPAIHLSFNFSLDGKLTGFMLEINEVKIPGQTTPSPMPVVTDEPLMRSTDADVPISESSSVLDVMNEPTPTQTPTTETITIADMTISVDIKSLDLHGKNITDISPLSSLTELTYLNLEDNLIEDLSPLSGLTQLKSLWLGKNRIADISPLEGLIRLEGLGLQRNQIVDVAPLANMTHLVQLWLYSNKITDISALSGLTELTALHLNGNSIADLSPVSHVEYVDVRQ